MHFVFKASTLKSLSLILTKPVSSSLLWSALSTTYTYRIYWENKKSWVYNPIKDLKDLTIAVHGKFGAQKANPKVSF